jgi:hypothetical protein
LEYTDVSEVRIATIVRAVNGIIITMAVHAHIINQGMNNRLVGGSSSET